MPIHNPSEADRQVHETAMQQSIFEQAQATPEMNPARVTRQDALLHDNDLLTSNGDNDIPPPAYGDIYGEIRNEKDGLGTSAFVTDDGRVNIRINQLNRRLSQVFTPALRQHVQSVEDSRPPPSAYVPPSLGGKEGIPPPPPLNIVIQVVGSRGDVQPFVALGKVLKETYGHRVRLATHPNFKDFVRENGLEFFSIGGDPSQLMAFMVKNPGLMPGFRSLMSGDVGKRRRDVAEYIQGCWRSCYKAGDGLADDSISAATSFVADCIIANPPSFAHIHCAEKLGIPLHIMFTMPYSPTQAFAHPLANIQSSDADPQLTNYISYAMIELLAWQGLGDIINRFRAKCLGLDAVSTLWAPGMLQRLKVPHTYCWSPALIPKPKDWGPHINISGFYFLHLASNYSPNPGLQAFLDSGPPPVYIGFGSIVLDDPNAMTELIFEAVKKTGQRVLLSKGWGGMGADELHIPDSVFMLGNVPHDWLFKQVSCVVHHGGAGTTAAGITAGRPTLVVPFFGDQPFWGAMVARAGAGPEPIPHKQLTSANLADAIEFCLKPESLDRARDLANKIAAERGTDMGAQLFHQYLEVDRLRCTLAPSRAAAWRLKRTNIRLSAFAAHTLANAGLLDLDDVKLFRAKEYHTDEGPYDPVSGSFTTACRAFSNMGIGLAEMPTETLKALRPSMSSRQRSQASSSFVSEGESSKMSRSPTSLDQSQTSLTSSRTPDRVQSPSTPNTTPNSKVVPSSEGQSSSKEDNASRRPHISRNESGSRKDHDVSGEGVAHTRQGVGRFVKALVQSPMELSMSITRGFHNAPKLLGDDTVRPQERVSDFKSGMNAMGREFAFGWYDGVTGVVTQPWKGARKDGASGFVKGIGKGVGGIIAKPGAAMFGIISHPMKGMHKELQKLYGNNVQEYIVATRASQGYQEWLQSSDAEKEDVIVRWKLIQKYLKKKKGDADEVVQVVLEAQRKDNMDNGNILHASVAQSADGADAPTQHTESAMLGLDGEQSWIRSTNAVAEEQLGATEINEAIRMSVQETSRGNTQEDADVERAIQESVSQLHHRRQDFTDAEELRQAVASSEAEAQQKVTEAAEFEEQLKQVMAQSLREQRQMRDSSEWESGNSSNNDAAVNFERTGGQSGKAAVQAGDTPGLQRLRTYDYGHLEGTTQDAFVAQQQGEKSTQERTEEEIVMAYVKKQSLLEAHHQNKGKSRASEAEDEDLEKALSLSMQDHGHGTQNRYGEDSKI